MFLLYCGSAPYVFYVIHIKKEKYLESQIIFKKACLQRQGKANVKYLPIFTGPTANANISGTINIKLFMANHHFA